MTRLKLWPRLMVPCDPVGVSCLTSHHTPGPERHLRRRRNREEDGRFSVYPSTCISIKEKLLWHASVCVRVCKNGYMTPPAHPPPTSPIFLCRGAEEVGRCHSNSVTVYWSSRGAERPSGEMMCLCRISLCVFLRVRLPWGVPELVEHDGLTAPHHGHLRNQFGLDPRLCRPGAGREPDWCLFITPVCSIFHWWCPLWVARFHDVSSTLVAEHFP